MQIVRIGFSIKCIIHIFKYSILKYWLCSFGCRCSRSMLAPAQPNAFYCSCENLKFKNFWQGQLDRTLDESSSLCPNPKNGEQVNEGKRNGSNMSNIKLLQLMWNEGLNAFKSIFSDHLTIFFTSTLRFYLLHFFFFFRWIAWSVCIYQPFENGRFYGESDEPVQHRMDLWCMIKCT